MTAMFYDVSENELMDVGGGCGGGGGYTNGGMNFNTSGYCDSSTVSGAGITVSGSVGTSVGFSVGASAGNGGISVSVTVGSFTGSVTWGPK